MPYSIGIDLGGTSIKLIAASDSGEVLSRRTDSTFDSAGIDWAPRIHEHVRQLQVEHGLASWAGLAAPGLAAPDGRTIWWMQGRLDAVQGFDWTSFLADCFPEP